MVIIQKNNTIRYISYVLHEWTHSTHSTLYTTFHETDHTTTTTPAHSLNYVGRPLAPSPSLSPKAIDRLAVCIQHPRSIYYVL